MTTNKFMKKETVSGSEKKPHCVPVVTVTVHPQHNEQRGGMAAAVGQVNFGQGLAYTHFSLYTAYRT